MNDLRPPVLDELGLVPAIQEELQQLAEKPGCRVNKALSFGERLPRGVELTLYRIFREALVNVQRHAQATAVEVILHGEGEGVRLEVSDNGGGFDIQEAMKKKQVGGLLSMRRRAEAAGGTWGIESTPGRGTRLSVWLPLSPSNRDGANLPRSLPP
jgi:signal transduction histidine kinase